LICEHYNIDRQEVEKRVEQCLAKRFEQIPRVYRLKEGVMLAKEEPKSVRGRLIYVLNELGGEGTLNMIRLKYQEKFKDHLDTELTINSN
jgi:hypothetical protein